MKHAKIKTALRLCQIGDLERERTRGERRLRRKAQTGFVLITDVGKAESSRDFCSLDYLFGSNAIFTYQIKTAPANGEIWAANAELTRGGYLPGNNTSKTTYLHLFCWTAFEDLMKARELVSVVHQWASQHMTLMTTRTSEHAGWKPQHLITPRWASQLEVLWGQGALWEVVGV